MSDPAPNQPAPRGYVEKTPEAGPPKPPAWRDHFADPILQPGQRHDPDRAAANAPTPVAISGTQGQPAATEAAPSSSAPPVRPLGRIEEPVLEAGQVTPETVFQSVKEFVDAPQEERNRRARELGRQLRPLAADAEVFAAKALNLGARGLNGLAERLERRRREREGTPGGN